MNSPEAPIWPVWVRTDQVGDKGYQLDVTADAEDRQRIADFCGVEAIDAVQLTGLVTRWRANRLGGQAVFVGFP